MRRVVAFAVAALFVVLAGTGAQDKQDKKDEKTEAAKPDPDLKLLQGRWKITYHETAGEKDTDENLWEMEVKGDRYTLTADGTRTTGTIKLDSSKTPKQLEYTVGDEDTPTTYHGIYELSADVYQTCDTEKGVDPRPTEFKTKARTGQIAVWKKVKVKD
jgi:uncharacterized protein (TIGR03067 family)